MTDTRQHEILRNLFATARELPPAGLGPRSSVVSSSHPIDDEDLLLDWSLGDLSPERHQQLIDHLAACPPCRREISAMVRLGILELHVPEEHLAAEHVAASFQDADSPAPHSLARNSLAPISLAPDSPAHPVSESPDHVWSPWRRRTVFALVTALAASLLVMFARGLFDFGPRDGAALIAMAQRDLQQGRAADAFARIEDYLARTDGLTAERRDDGAAILEASGYELARSGLTKGDFKGVSDIDARVARRSGGSARLANLRIQAERGETAERSLSGRMSLREHYDFELDGQQVIKSFSFPEITATHKRIEAELKNAIESYPDAVDLRLNYGQFLLDQNEFERAAAVFANAVAIDPQNVLAHTGLGLALLQQDHPDAATRALPHFQAAVRLSPDDPVMNQNLAICRNRQSLNAQP